MISVKWSVKVEGLDLRRVEAIRASLQLWLFWLERTKKSHHDYQQVDHHLWNLRVQADGPNISKQNYNSFLEKVYEKRNHICQLLEENDPKHTSKQSQTMKVRNRIQVIEWSSKSTECNPIKSFWSLIKTKIRQRNIRT